MKRIALRLNAPQAVQFPAIASTASDLSREEAAARVVLEAMREDLREVVEGLVELAAGPVDTADVGERRPLAGPVADLAPDEARPLLAEALTVGRKLGRPECALLEQQLTPFYRNRPFGVRLGHLGLSDGSPFQPLRHAAAGFPTNGLVNSSSPFSFARCPIL